ncbi:MAG TPA: response regulator, partial [Thermodesulfobacteriota bacterium]|nr:response regulator [Thermodesulfobacteriota bacterium]
MKILVVDDNQTTRKLIGMYLKSRGLNVVFAENGLDAIEKLADPDVGLVLTDLNMPYMDGLEFVKTLRASPNWAALP